MIKNSGRERRVGAPAVPARDLPVAFCAIGRYPIVATACDAPSIARRARRPQRRDAARPGHGCSLPCGQVGCGCASGTASALDEVVETRSKCTVVRHGSNPRPPAGARTIALLAILSLAAVSCSHAQAGPDETPLQGIVEYDDRVLGFEVAGRVLAAEVVRGQDVKADALLLRLDDGLETPIRDLRAAEVAGAEAQLRLLRAGTRAEELRAAQAEVAALQSQEDILGKNLKRQQTLFEQNALPQSTVDDTAAQLKATSDRRRALDERLLALRNGPRGDEIDAAVARVQAAQASLAAQQARLARYALRSPISGSVVDVHVEVGELVTPGSPAVTLADLTHPYLEIFVPQGRAHELRVGDAMQVVVDGVTTPLAGRVEHVFPKTEFTPRFLFSEGERPNLVIRMRVRVDDPNRLLHAGVPAFATPVKAPAGPESGARP